VSASFPPLEDRYLELRARAKALADQCLDLAEKADESDSTDPDVLRLLKESGLAAVQVPAAYGGTFEQPDSLAGTIIREQLAASSSHLDSLFAMQGIGSFAISVGGAEEVKQTWLPRVASMDAIAALALTEPEVGSDLKALTTTVRVDGDELVVNGTKSFITNGGRPLLLRARQGGRRRQGGVHPGPGAGRYSRRQHQPSVPDHGPARPGRHRLRRGPGADLAPDR